MNIKVMKDTLTVIQSKTNICENKKRIDLVVFAVGQLAVPPDCPVNSEMTFCHDNKKILTFSAVSRRLLSGTLDTMGETVLRVDITHDSGKSCFDLITEINKT